MTQEWHSICSFFSKSSFRGDRRRMESTRAMEGITMRRLKDIKGVTLLEMAVALFILTIGLLGLVGLQLVTMKNDALGQQATLATTLAKEKVAELQEANQLTDGEDTYIDKVNGVTYARYWTVQPEQLQAEMTTVKVQVSWQGPMVDRCVTVSTVVKRT